MIKQTHPRVARHRIEQMLSQGFADWFAQKVEGLRLEANALSKDLALLANRPNFIGQQHESFVVNGFKFQTRELDSRRKTQNSGVRVTATTSSFSSTRDQNLILSDLDYYGVLTNIIELDYGGAHTVVLFECDWISKGKRLKQDSNGFTLENFSKLKKYNEPFILASQAK